MSAVTTQSELVLSNDGSVAVPNGCEQTEIGVIPEDWITTNARSIAASTPNAIVGGPFGSDLVSRDYVNQGVPVIRGQNMGERWIGGSFVFVSQKKADTLEANLARPGDVVFTQRGTLGQVSVVPYEPYARYLVSQSQMKLTPNHEVTDSTFLYYLFIGETQQDYIRQNTIQTGVPHINLGILRSIPVCLPSLPEQRAIAKALSDVDALISALDELIAKKRAIKLAAMQQLLTGKTRLPGFGATSGEKRSAAGVLPADWEALPLADLFTFKNGINKAKRYFGFGTPIVNYMDVFERPGLYAGDLVGRVSLSQQELKNFETRKGDVFFTRTSETVDEIGIASVMLDDPCDTVFSGFVLRARPKDGRIDNLYKKYCFSTMSVRKQIVSKSSYTTRALTNGRLLSAVILAIPPLEEQRAIAAVLSDMDAEIEALERRREKTTAIKQGMMQALLTGRVRLVRPEVAA